MAKRIPVTTEQNIWFDAQQVDNSDLSSEQNYNDTVQSSNISNHIGSGVLQEVLTQNILFDSKLITGYLDGKAILPQNQPNDNNLGNQLEISLIDSKCAGKKKVKVAVIGLDFAGNLQYETFVFKTNEKQISKKHFAKILILLFNDFFGNPSYSLNLGGNILIKEAKPLSLSRDSIMVGQDIEPNLFFRDFFVDGSVSLQNLLETALPLYDVDSLAIYTAEKENMMLLANDVSTQIGQKFEAKTNNIQKITLLLSVQNTEVGDETDLVWTGDLILSLYPLQSNIDCLSDIAPNLPIEFSPSNIPLAQLSVNYASLLALGIELNSVPQPVDFVVSNTPVASGNIIKPGSYYAVALKRAGSANKCDILMASGSDVSSNSRITTFTGSLWVDIPEADLWYQIHTDAAKISDGQGYESGHGFIVEKTALNSNKELIDYNYGNVSFSGNEVYKAVVSANLEEFAPVPDQRTGQPVNSRKQFKPSVSLLNTIDINNLQNTSTPLIIGGISDKNTKFYDDLSATINSKLYSATIVKNELVIKIVDDPTDSGRYDTSVASLASNILNGDFVNAIFTPDKDNSSNFYRIADASLCSMIVGDVNNDGVVDEEDLKTLNSYLGFDLNTSLSSNTIVTTDGYVTTFTNGYNSLSKKFSNAYNVSFQIMNQSNNAVLASGTDGIILANSDNRTAQFSSAFVNFLGISNLTDHKIVLLNSLTPENYGGYEIVSVSSLDVLTIRKVYLDSDSYCEMLRADIDEDFAVSTNDGYLLESYINRFELDTVPIPPYPAPTTNAYNKIGTTFNLLKFKLEKFVDRDDDYSSVVSGRSTSIHLDEDIFLSDGYLQNHNFYSSPVNFSIKKQLSWSEHLLISTSVTKGVPCVFSEKTGYSDSLCDIVSDTCASFPIPIELDNGVNDLYIPNDLIIGNNGQIKRPDGSSYKVDFEVGTIVIEVPTAAFSSEKTINVFDVFVANYNNGLTRLGFKAMQFADCSYVDSNALANNQLRFSAAIQSFSPNIDGYTIEDYSGPIVDGRIGLAIDYSTGLLSLNFSNLYQDLAYKTLSTKIQINVFMKKSGFNNNTLFVDSTKVKNLLGL